MINCISPNEFSGILCFCPCLSRRWLWHLLHRRCSPFVCTELLRNHLSNSFNILHPTGHKWSKRRLLDVFSTPLCHKGIGKTSKRRLFDQSCPVGYTSSRADPVETFSPPFNYFGDHLGFLTQIKNAGENLIIF